MNFNRINTITPEDILYEIAFKLQENYNQPLMTLKSFKEHHKDQADIFYPYFEDTLESLRLIDTIKYKKHPDYQLLFEPLMPGSDVGVSSLIPQSKTEDSDEKFLKIVDLHFEDVGNMEGYYEWVQREDLSDSAKYRLMLLGSARPMMIEKYRNFMSQFEDVATIIVENMKDKAKAYIDSIDPEEFVKQAKGIGMDFDGFETINLSVFVIGHNALRVIQNETDPKGINVNVGINIFELWKLREQMGAEKERLLKRLKMMSDPTKFEIIMFCLETERYGKEIAEYLSLSEATVSHHMQQLLSEQFVSIRVQKNRTYYITTKPNVLGVIENLENLIR